MVCHVLRKSVNRILTHLTVGLTSSTYDRVKGIEDVSYEIVDRICDYLTSGSLKNLRLVSRRYGGVTTKRIYEEVVVWGTSDNWEKLCHIAANQALACMVRCIKVARVNKLFLLDKSIWEQFIIYPQGWLKIQGSMAKS